MNAEWLKSKDFWAGVLYIAFGAVGYYVGQSYPMGSGARMGSGYFPIVLSVALLVTGVVSLLRAVISGSDLVQDVHLKPAALVTAATVLFALLLPGAGFVPALAVLILVAASASRHFSLDPKSLLGMIALVAICALVFVKGLGVPMPLLGTWFTG